MCLSAGVARDTQPNKLCRAVPLAAVAQCQLKAAAALSLIVCITPLQAPLPTFRYAGVRAHSL